MVAKASGTLDQGYSPKGRKLVRRCQMFLRCWMQQRHIDLLMIPSSQTFMA